MNSPGGESTAAPSGTLRAEVSADWAREAPLALILLHGYGADERDLASLGPMLALATPWASLRAPLPVAGGGYAWFPVSPSGDPDPARATDAVWRWVAGNLNPDAKIAVVGFSQGGLMATQLLRTHPERVAATVVLSGWVLAAPQPADGRLEAERPAVFRGRGDRDRLIAAEAVERTSRWLPTHSALTDRVYPGLAHGIADREVDDVRTFLIGQLWG